MAEFSVFMLPQGITPGSGWLWSISLKDYKIIWKIKMREMKAKIYLETLIELWMKWRTRDGGNETQRLYRCGSNYV